MNIFYLLLSICCILLSCKSTRLQGLNEKLKSVKDIDISNVTKRQIKLIALKIPLDTFIMQSEKMGRWACVTYTGPMYNVDSKLDSLIISIDSSMVQSTISGQIYLQDSIDYESNIEPFIEANLKFINLTRNTTISALTDFDGNYSAQLSSGKYEIIVSFPRCNTLHLYGLKVSSFESIKFYATLGFGNSSTFINTKNLMIGKQ